jgi:serine protease AprX
MKVSCGQRGGWLGGRRRSLSAGLAVVSVSALALVAAGVSWGATSYNPAKDPYSMYAITQLTGATAWWNAGYTGKGVDVALIDTGVAPVAALAGAGKIVNGPDLSLESQNPLLAHLDTNGHGTFMAGLIAGHDSTLTAPYASAPASAYRGIAPDARIVNVKVGVADGGVDVTQVIAAVDWVVQHAHDPGFNIRVISLSYGTNSLQDPSVDPLAYAVEQAWLHGIVVVAAAGNSGFQQGNGASGLADPAYDPYLIAAGGVDTMGTSTLSDDTIGSYSASAGSCGKTTCRPPDVVAPGSHVQGLRNPGSYIDQNHPEGLISSLYFRGSGTSEATAITAGAVALVLSRYPNLTPDQVKAYLAVNAQHLSGAGVNVQGNGEIVLGAMLASSPPAAGQIFTPATGTGTLEGARGSDHLSMNGVALTGEQDIFGHAFDSTSIAAAEAAGNSWSGGSWNGNSWSGNSWSGNSWSGNSWSGNSWSGNSWSSLTWSGNSWSGNSWSGNSWSGNSWSGNSWSGNSWSGGSWN